MDFQKIRSCGRAKSSHPTSSKYLAVEVRRSEGKYTAVPVRRISTLGADLELSGREVDAGAGDRLRIKPDEDVRAETVIHVVPATEHNPMFSASGASRRGP